MKCRKVELAVTPQATRAGAWKRANAKIDANAFTRADWDELLAMALALPRPEQDQELEAVAEIGLLEGVVTADELGKLLPPDDD